MGATLEADVGRKSTKVPKGKPAPEPMARKPMVVQIRGSEEWKAWVEGIADREGFSVAMLCERALRRFAKEGGYPEPPKR